MSAETTRGDPAPDPLPVCPREDVARSIDQFLGASQSVIDQLAVIRKMLSQRLVTKGIGHRSLRTGPTGDIPDAWEVRSLGEIARFASGKPKPKDASHAFSRPHATPIYGAKGLLGFSSSILRNGPTIVVGRVGAHCGALHFVSDEASWITDNALFVYETRPEVDLRFLYHSLCELDLPSLRSTGRQPVISLSTIYPILLALPPLPEQREICEFLSSVESLVEVQGRVLGQARRVRSAFSAGVPPVTAAPAAPLTGAQ